MIFAFFQSDTVNIVYKVQFFTAWCTTVQSTVLLLHVVCPSICLSVCHDSTFIHTNQTLDVWTWVQLEKTI